MGEYATRISDGASIKIGTCEEMFYLRFEDRDKVRAQQNSVDVGLDKVAGQLLFRLPFPDEGKLLPGDYPDPDRAQRLYRSAFGSCEDFTDESTLDDAGIMQLRHEASGLLLNVPCYHGQKLPEVLAPMKAFWNGKGHSFELSKLRAVLKDNALTIYPVVKCRHCGHAWRYEWSQVLEWIPQPLRSRLEQYANKNEVQ